MVAGVEMVCDAAPPSDHDVKSYESTPRNWLGGAATPTVEFCATERVNGVVDASPPTASRRPDGSLANVSSTILGSSRTDVVPRRPEVAVAVRPVPGQLVRRVLTYAPTSSTEWTPAAVNWFVPNWFVDVTATLERKVAAFAHYETERREFPHPRSERAIRAAASFYGSSCGCEAAEPFVLVRALEPM